MTQQERDTQASNQYEIELQNARIALEKARAWAHLMPSTPEGFVEAMRMIDAAHGALEAGRAQSDDAAYINAGYHITNDEGVLR